ncbi:MAG: TIGR03619 family F420-dependent LLM class oxidoreductase [Hyphomicrobiales bacterium]|nr:TIGR03619 family F420-dependent LLM class oxidoreductase [Hyphomicrobiales bacterium]MBV8824847.1 TIGR03619 family F420-dependent LLM class oxidoreductase [Hyphomicrobiales bacterium]
MARLAVEGEAIGYDYACVSDHVVEPRDIRSRYPYSDTGEFPPASRGERHEQLTAIAYLAGKTSRLRFLTSVMVVPHRPAVLTAKMLATIDVLSGGRLIVGIGAGWLKEEFEALGTPPFEERGAVTDEYMRAFRELWTKDAPQFDGRYVKFKDVVFAPKPVQKCPPIWVGGESGPALRRSARLGDGWYPIGTNPQFPMNTMGRYRAAAERLRKLTQEAGRKAGACALTYRVQRFGPQVPAKADNGERMLFSGSDAEIIEDVRAMRELGLAALDINFAAASTDDAIATMRKFHEQVLAKAL